MADFRIALGGTISAATTDEMHSALGTLKHDLMSHSAKPKKIYRPLSASSAGLTVPTSVTSTPITLKLGRPSSGRIWVVTRIVMLGADDNTAATNLVASVYIGDEMNVGLSQCVRHGTTFPFTTTENEHAYIVHDREDIFVRVIATGAATTTQVSVNALAWEYRDTDIDAQVI